MPSPSPLFSKSTLLLYCFLLWKPQRPHQSQPSPFPSPSIHSFSIHRRVTHNSRLVFNNNSMSYLLWVSSSILLLLYSAIFTYISVCPHINLFDRSGWSAVSIGLVFRLITGYVIAIFHRISEKQAKAAAG